MSMRLYLDIRPELTPAERYPVGAGYIAGAEMDPQSPSLACWSCQHCPADGEECSEERLAAENMGGYVVHVTCAAYLPTEERY